MPLLGVGGRQMVLATECVDVEALLVPGLHVGDQIHHAARVTKLVVIPVTGVIKVLKVTRVTKVRNIMCQKNRKNRNNNKNNRRNKRTFYKVNEVVRVTI